RLRETKFVRMLERTLEGEPGFYEGPYHTTLSGDDIFISYRVSPLRDANGDVVGGIALMEDVTERMEATTKLRLSEERLKLHVKDSPLGVIVLDNEARVVEWNEGAARMFGWSPEEMFGQRL